MIVERTYQPVWDALITLREISEFEKGNVIGIAYRLRARLQAQIERIPLSQKSLYVKRALQIWDGTDG